MTTKSQKIEGGWESEFEKLLKDKVDYPARDRKEDGFNCTPQELKAFISDLLASERQRCVEANKELLVDSGYMIETIIGYVAMKNYEEAESHLEVLSKMLLDQAKQAITNLAEEK